ncbi:MAG: M42 family metallopeptidase [Eubacteriales bacterium]|nr:M42 family metallopeptidase [Eubacteriales bacterium]
MFLKKLCEFDCVSGNEKAVRDYIRNEIYQYADEIVIDSIGNLIVKRTGVSSKKTVMLDAHTDEVGFIISGITDKGFLEFKTVGGIDTRVIISKRVRVGKNKIPGVIGIKAIHLLEKSERNEVPKIKSLYIDIGASSKEEAEKYVELGDYAAFDTEYEDLTDDLIKAKAIDDRAGCAILMELIKEKPKYDTYFCFSAQEEVGLRGAKIAVNRIKPDIALAIEATTSSDVAPSEEKDYVIRLGNGAAVSFADGATIASEEFYKKLLSVAEEEGIKAQTKAAITGGNDAGAIHLAQGGIKCATISVPCRYIHSPAGIASKADIDSVKQLAGAFLRRIDEFY